jgi:hypothetical protein
MITPYGHHIPPFFFLGHFDRRSFCFPLQRTRRLSTFNTRPFVMVKHCLAYPTFQCLIGLTPISSCRTQFPFLFCSQTPEKSIKILSQVPVSHWLSAVGLLKLNQSLFWRNHQKFMIFCWYLGGSSHLVSGL